MPQLSGRLVALAGLLLIGSCSPVDSPTDPTPDPVSTPDVSISIAASDTSPVDGDTVRVTVQVTNTNRTGAAAVTSLQVLNVAEAGLSLVASSTASGTFNAPAGV